MFLEFYYILCNFLYYNIYSIINENEDINMRIIIDGDGCPATVRQISERLAHKYETELITVIDMSHDISSDFPIIVVEKGRDSVDYKIAQIFKKNDILITQDYGLASIVLTKAKGIIHTAGFLINNNNIDSLLESRHLGQKLRKAGCQTKGASKRTKEQDIKFEKLLTMLLTDCHITVLDQFR